MTQEKINVLIVEDESIVAMDLAAGLEKSGYNVVGIADNSVEANELFRENAVDILLMDINILGDKDGVETAAELMQFKKVPLIYLTAFTDTKTVSRVKETHPSAFLTKPYNMSNVMIAIELAINNFSQAMEKSTPSKTTAEPQPSTNETAGNETILQMENSIFIKQNYKFIKVSLPDILYTESDNNYIHLITAERKYTLRMSLQQFQDKLNYKNFIRIHRSYLVNMQAIKSFTETEVQIGDAELPISRTYHDAFVKQFYA